MKGIMVFVSFTCLILMTSQVVGQQLITPEQAKQAVRAFEGNPNLEFETIELRHDTSGPSWSHRSWYELNAKENYPHGHWWNVDARTGEVLSAHYPETLPANPVEPFGPLTKEQCRQIAENFSRAKYQNFDQMNLQLVAEEWTGRGWRFEWRQKLAFGALSLNGVEVEVNPSDGRIQSYSAIRIGIVNPREPKLTKEQAIERAKEATGIVEVDWVEGPELVADPMGNVYWSLALGGGDVEGKYRGYAVQLNAETGQVLSMSPQEGVAKPVIPPHFRFVKQGRWWQWLVGMIILLALTGVMVVFKLRRRTLKGQSTPSA